jgi:1-acyl-sn-glycerol-3-phosphate acyltransferase
MIKWIARLILKLIGWTYSANTPDFKKSVLVVAPHTSNWDFIIGELGYRAMGRKAHFVIKREWMIWPIGWLIRLLGGFPVDRSKPSHFNEQIIELFKTRETFNLAITPEGTRKRNPKWKRGFYRLAVKAGVPIVLVKIDYGQKHMSLFDVFQPTGNESADIKAVKEKYRGAVGRHPDQFSIGD